jgi:Cof subfamily protein (haloacid dehalogenase superfamily)
MNIRCVALDLDRTTLNAEGKLSNENRAAIMAAIEHGVHICIASGRAFDTLPEDVLSIPGIEYAITSNGAAVYRIKDKACIRSYLLTPASVEAILKVAEETPATYEAFIDGVAYADYRYVENPKAFGASDQAVTYIKRTRHSVDDICHFIMEHKEELDSLDIVINDEEIKEDLRKRIAKVTDEVYMTSSIRQLLEISYKDAGKHSGLRFISEMLHIPREAIAAFGDADNDIDMIEYAGCGIAMENASERLLHASDYVTLHHDKNGVAYAFQHILKIC